MTDTTSESNDRHAQGPGRLLREAREQLRMSVEDLSAQVKLSGA
jgi:ribosome-binding protein aMBF1 (putative translation factor)